MIYDLYYILLEEIQLVNNFESLLNGLLRKENLDIYVTDSNSRFLSTYIITEFKGNEIRVYALSKNFILTIMVQKWMLGLNIIPMVNYHLCYHI